MAAQLYKLTRKIAILRNLVAKRCQTPFIRCIEVWNPFLHQPVTTQIPYVCCHKHNWYRPQAESPSKWFDPLRRQGVLLFPKSSIPALGPTQPPVQWETELFPRKVKRPKREGDHSIPSSAEVRNEWELYL